MLKVKEEAGGKHVAPENAPNRLCSGVNVWISAECGSECYWGDKKQVQQNLSMDK